ncbi:protein CHUP1, chloroplastic-like isoform X2 [Iris pallida]|uniref:Protein CHUP1, chloroplastic-like isoform X2 n=2 Tax=Iris pallida TaxID=29817 RepID=A0AAX6DZ41_IRIPA|nr:protein CHUP1, chloroplastic-like isoform X2 [Iris pallida]
MEGKLLIRSRKDPKPLLLKLGFALALSIAGYFASNLRFRPRLPPPDGGPKRIGETSTRNRAGGLRDQLRVLSSEEELAKVVNGTSNCSTNSMVIDDFRILSSEEELVKIVVGTSNSCTTAITAATKVIEEDRFVMEEFEGYPESKPMKKRNDESEKEKEEEEEEEKEKEKEKFEFEAYPESEPMKSVNDDWEREKSELQHELAYLRNLVEALKERERTLEVQLLKYYGLKEQEATLRELENRVKVNAMESKLLYLKIDSLQADNQKLQSQVSDYPRAVAELESAREEIKVLKGRLKLVGEEAKEKLASLNQSITNLQDRILKDGETNAEVEKKLTRVKELEGQFMDLQIVNSRLAEENLKLVQQLESEKMAASSNLEHWEAEASHLREENEKLKKEIEQLQTDRCTDVEELVYLRWVNACLRYELRNYQPPPGKTVAKDIGNSLSPVSEQKVKQLILEYAHSGINDGNMNLLDFDTESCSSSRASSEECMDTSIDISSTKKSKSKFLSKLKKLVLGKDGQRSKDKVHGTPTSCGSTSRRLSISPCSAEDLSGVRRSVDSSSSCISVENATANHLTGMDSRANEQWLNNIARSQKVSRLSLDVERMRRLDVGAGKDNIGERCKSDIGASRGHMRMISEDECSSELFQNQEHDDSDEPEKVKLKKFAYVLKGSRGSQKQKRSAPSSSD